MLLTSKLPIGSIVEFNSVRTRGIIFQEMEESPYQFYLTGSRFFGTSTAFSDWDFFIEGNPFDPNWFDKFLNPLGFNQIYVPHEYQRSDHIHCVYRHPIGIDIQIVKNARNKEIAQDILYPLAGYLESLPKSQRFWVWENCLNHLSSQENV